MPVCVVCDVWRLVIKNPSECFSKKNSILFPNWYGSMQQAITTTLRKRLENHPSLKVPCPCQTPINRTKSKMLYFSIV